MKLNIAIKMWKKESNSKMVQYKLLNFEHLTRFNIMEKWTPMFIEEIDGVDNTAERDFMQQHKDRRESLAYENH